MKAICPVGLAGLLCVSCATTQPEAGFSGLPEIAQFLDSKVSEYTKGHRANNVISTLTKPSRIGVICDHYGTADFHVEISLDLKGRKVSDALRAVCRAAGLDYCALAEALYISTPERESRARRRGSPMRIGDPALRQQLDKPMHGCFCVTPFGEMVAFYASLTNGRVVSRLGDQDEQIYDSLVTFRNVPLHSALHWLAVVSDAELKIEDGTVVLVPRRKRPEE